MPDTLRRGRRRATIAHVNPGDLFRLSRHGEPWHAVSVNGDEVPGHVVVRAEKIEFEDDAFPDGETGVRIRGPFDIVREPTARVFDHKVRVRG